MIEIVYKKTGHLIEYEGNPRNNAHAVDRAAAAIRKHGFRTPVLIEPDLTVVDGHLRLKAARKLGLEEVPCSVISDMSPAEVKAFRISINKIADLADWDEELLALELEGLKDDGFDLDSIGFDEGELQELLGDVERSVSTQEGEDEVPDTPDEPVTQLGDVWALGRHRLMCGDSTVAEDVELLMNGRKAVLLHADPPYGMGKEGKGVLNDNIYGKELDAFQLRWWTIFRPHIENNGSAYIWGNAPDLWRLWYQGGLSATEHLVLRNELVWDKKSVAGMKSPLMTQYPVASERCLYFQFGPQFLGSVNACDYPEEFEIVRGYLSEEADNCGLSSKDIVRLCGRQMYSHWFSKSQFCLIPKKHYEVLGETYRGSFCKPWDALKKDWDAVKGKGSMARSEKAAHTRSYFNNSHDVMRDVWEFPRVTGAERLGHATPKPVSMLERCLVTSAGKGDLVVEPFIGSGATLIAAEKTGRICYGMELSPQYCDVTIRRWEEFTGEIARKI